MKKIVYNEGDLFRVSINDFEYVVGLIARINGNKMLCYFFDSKIFTPQENKIEKEKAILTKMCSTLGLDKKEWKLVGRLNNWDRNEWEVPVFKKVDILSKECYEVFYNDLLEEVNTSEAVDCKLLTDYPEDGFAGYGFIQKRLIKLLE